VKGQAKKDEIKEVKDGYAINYLIKNNLAVKYTEKSNEKLLFEQKKRGEEAKELVDAAKALKQKLEDVSLVFKVKTGKEDKVFGSISSKQVKEALDNLGYDIPKNKIKIDEPISTLDFILF